MSKFSAQKPRLGDYFSQRTESGREGLPTLSVTLRDGLVFRDDLDRKTDTSLEHHEHLLARKGDIAYNMMRMWQGASGRAATDGLVSPAYVVLSPTDRIDTRFAAHWFKSPRMIYLFWAYSHGLTEDRLRLYYDDFAEIPAAPPPLSEQRRIAAILDEWDNAIITGERLLEAKRHRKEGIRRALFDSNWRLRKYPGDWSPIPLANLLKIRGETSIGDETVYSVSVSKGLVDQVEHLGRSFSAANTDNYNRVCFGDIVYTKSPTGSFPLGIVKQSYIDDDVIVSPLYGVYVPKSVAHGRLIDLYFSSPPAAEKYLAPFVHRGAKNTMAITDEGFLAGEIPMPPTQEEADATGELIEALDNEIGRLEDYCDHLRLQKRGLMQKLLSGDWPMPASIDRLLPGELCIDQAAGAEAKRAEATR
ncbi:hypothetical protein F9K87_00595 [Brucella anthropi]|uniref:restriction endonuclease subunit S n=1 Tax=Brucella anthropi TaxID=529 RepID=UPI00124CBB56|nr:hypothetical protein [Brucella anthropi]KAB2800011.1 hypothetical protein F9K87_00595 [Brucella anthropi]